MKTFILAFSLIMAASSWAGSSIQGNNAGDTNKVYVSNGKNGKTYHSKINCCGMFYTRDNITCTMAEAEKEGMMPCQICYRHSTGSKSITAKK